MEQRPEPQDDDYTILDDRKGYFVCGIGETFADFDDAIEAIVKDMDAAKYWPDVWYVNDHGNLDLLAINKGKYSTVQSWV